MHGDFSRDSYNLKSNFTRVLMQQGRLIVDADWNEQSAIMLNYLQTLAADIIGWHGGPNVTKDDQKAPTGGAFAVRKNKDNTIKVSGGRYYVDGILVEEDEIQHIIQDNEKDATHLPNALIYLNVWEKHIVAEDDDSIRDAAFGESDTTSRGRLITEIHMLNVSLKDDDEMLTRPETQKIDGTDKKGFRDIVIEKRSAETGESEPVGVIDDRKLRENERLPCLTAWVNNSVPESDTCGETARSGYTGVENQLYRVEVHTSGTFWKPDEKNTTGAFTLKWSRDNGSIVYAANIEGNTATLLTSWRDESRAIQPGHWIELIKEDEEQGVMFQAGVVKQENGVTTITLDVSAENSTSLPAGKVLIRRWDHQHRKHFPVTEAGGFLVKQETDKEVLEKLKESGTPSVAIPVEDNLFVKLLLPDNANVKAGDYWLIPARTATGDIIWPFSKEKEKQMPARYTQHHFAPLALLIGVNNEEAKIIDLRNNLSPQPE